MNYLSTVSGIENVQYCTYFFSCNFDHVIYDMRSLDSKLKTRYAREFRDKYFNNLGGFVEFMNDEHFAIPGDYPQTWNYLRSGSNSLNRNSNFHLFVNMVYPGL